VQTSFSLGRLSIAISYSPRKAVGPVPSGSSGLDRSERIAAAILSFFFTIGFFIEYLPPAARVHLWSDIAGYHYPLQAYALRAIREGRLPLWDATIYGGISFVGNIQAAVLYPPSWLLYLSALGASRLPYKLFELFAFLHIWLAFVLCYVWLRGRAGKMGSALGAAAFAYSGFMMYEILHPGAAWAMTWLPLGLCGIDEAVDRRDWRPLWKLAAASALSFLAGYPAASLVCMVIALVYALFSRGHVRAAAGAAIAIGASALLAAMQLLPTLDGRSLMFLEPKYGPGAWGWRAILLSSFLPNWFDFNPGHPANYQPGAYFLYLGLPAVFAIAYAVRRHRLGPYLQPGAVLGLALLLANPPDALVRAVERVPTLDQTMQPFNFYIGLSAMAALITALGVDSFLKARAASRRSMPAWAAAAVSVVMAVWVLRQLSIWMHGGKFAAHGRSILPAAAGLAIFAAALWAYRASRGRSRVVLAAVILLLAGVDYKVFSAARWFNAMPGDADAEFNASGMRGMNEVPYRTLTANRHYRIALDEGASPYSTDLRYWGLTTPQGFDPFLPAQYRDRIERWVKFNTNRIFFVDVKNEEMLQTLGVRYVITHQGMSNEPYLAQSPAFRPIGINDSYYRVFEYLRARPTYRWEQGGGEATPIVWTPERRDLIVQSEQGGRFILVEQFYPGWHARVDGRPVAIERWDGAFDSVVLPPGRHRVSFVFRPRSLYIGGAITLLAVAGLALVIVSDLRRRRAAATAAGETALHTPPSHGYGRPWPGLPLPERPADWDSDPAAPAASPARPASYRGRTTA
jgi:hypothetical protein